jgi:hypothetical protein
VTVAANLWVEQEYYYDQGWELFYNPTLGASYELSPHVSVGVEGWVRGRFDDSAQPTRVFLGPVVLAQLGEYWASVGGYVRLDTLGDTLLVGENFGPLYLRAILGMGF